MSHAISQETIDAYAELSGDFNPLHVDPEYAGRSEFGSTIAHGPIGLQTFFELLARRLDAEWPPPGTRVEVVYRGPVRPGDVVTCEISTGENGTATAECRVRGGTVVSVTSTVL